MRTFGIAQLVSLYRKEFNTEITEKDQSTEKKKTERVFPAGPGRKKRRKTRHYKKPLQKHN